MSDKGLLQLGHFENLLYFQILVKYQYLTFKNIDIFF